MTRDDVLKAMADYRQEFPNNDYDLWTDKDTYKWAVEHDGHYYPVKWLVARVMGVQTPELNTHNDATRALQKLGFKVVPKPMGSNVVP
jgi:hypothetical protein